jgi:hypothetical protein
MNLMTTNLMLSSLVPVALACVPRLVVPNAA